MSYVAGRAALCNSLNGSIVMQTSRPIHQVNVIWPKCPSIDSRVPGLTCILKVDIFAWAYNFRGFDFESKCIFVGSNICTSFTWGLFVIR